MTVGVLNGPVLVTGANGFVGGHLQTALAARAVEVCAFEGDVRSGSALEAAIRACAPTAIVHLAARASVAQSWSQEREVWDVNAGGTLNLLLAAASNAPAARVLVVSSAEVYGKMAEDERPLRETRPVAPVSPYGRSKAAAEIASLRGDLDIIVARPFPHMGPGQDVRFAVASFADQIARLERKHEPAVVRVGDLSVIRDMLDVRCVADAYVRLLVAAEPPSIVNVASGIGTPLHEIVAHLIALAKKPVTLEPDPGRMRRVDIPRLVGDPTLLRRATAWTPTRALTDTLRDVLDEARKRVANS